MKKCVPWILLLCVWGSLMEYTVAQVEEVKESEPFYWSIPLEYAAIKPRVSYVPGVMVIRGDTQVIVPEHKSFCPAGSVFTYNNGDIEVFDKRSKDGGKSWQDSGHVLEVSTFQYPDPDGEVIMFQSSYSSEHVTGEGRPEVSMVETDTKGVYKAKFFRSKDNGVTRVAAMAEIRLPEQFLGMSGVLCRKIVQIEDGSLLMSMYTRFPEGTILEKKFRSLALRSTDRGKTWNYWSTIAFDLSETARGEGFDETCLLPLANGNILSFSRSGASYQASMGSHNYGDSSVDMPHGYAKQTPIYMSKSLDNGKNWSMPDPISPYGVWPNALLMDNGLMVLNYGRPGNWFMFSQDEGESWGPIIPFHHGLYPPDCSNYFSIDEIAPNVLLVVYARTNPNDHWQSEIVGTYFYVERGIYSDPEE